ncbi:MAG: gamma-glutamyl-gamma-aminobutyrate hydrolase family protein [Actinomycetota bacterium]
MGDYRAGFEPHLRTDAALVHSANALGLFIESEWIATDEIEPTIFDTYNGILVAPGSPYRDMDKTLQAIRQAREDGVPCLGTCGGFQHMVIEVARNVLGFTDAQHAEYDPDASDLFISALECSPAGREMSVSLVPGSKAAGAYKATEVRESYYCNFGVNPERAQVLRGGVLQVVGSDEDGEIRVVELADHPFFVATLFVPQVRSSPGMPHPLVSAFLQAVMERGGPA